MVIRNILILFFLLLLSSCGRVTGPFSVYKMDIRQGNFVTTEMREKLKLGMSRQQVRYVLGTPMVNDAFHDNRWDYVYLLEHRGERVEQQRLTIYFEEDELVKIDDSFKSINTSTKIATPETSATSSNQ